MPLTDLEDLQVDIRAALPDGWHGGVLERHYTLDGREPVETFSCTFHWGVPIEGGRTMRYVGGSDIRKTHRRVDVSVTAKDIAQIVEFAKRLADLEPMSGLPWPLEFKVEGYPFPD